MPDVLAFPGRDESDGKAWFYLDHRNDIETWAALRSEASSLLDRYLISLESWFEELGQDRDALVETEDLEVGSWPRVGLHRAEWEHRGSQDVSIVLQWERARLLKPGPNEWPFVAVRMSRQQTDEGRRQRIASAVSQARARLKAPSAHRWPVWRYVTPPAQAGAVDPEALMAAATESFTEFWEVFAPILDEVHSDTGRV